MSGLVHVPPIQLSFDNSCNCGGWRRRAKAEDRVFVDGSGTIKKYKRKKLDPDAAYARSIANVERLVRARAVACSLPEEATVASFRQRVRTECPREAPSSPLTRRGASKLQDIVSTLMSVAPEVAAAAVEAHRRLSGSDAEGSAAAAAAAPSHDG